MRLVWAIRRAGRGIGGIRELSDVVAFLLSRCRLLVSCAVSSARRSSYPMGLGDEPMRWSEADEMDEMDEMNEAGK